MTLARWLRPLAARLTRGRPAVPRPRFRPGVMVLEDRTVPATFTVTNTFDTTDTTSANYVGSLRWAINRVNATTANDGPQQTINFNIPVTDQGHVCYQDDGVNGQLTMTKVAQTNL